MAKHPSPPEYDHIRLVVGPISELWLARPAARNAMTEDMGREVEDAVRFLNSRKDVRVVLLRGEGKGFSAGGDLSFLDARMLASPEENRRAMVRFYKLYLSVADLHVPSIALLHGAAIGAGLCFSLACDLRIAASHARFAFNFVRLGLHPGMGATYFLPRLVGSSRASELLLTGRVFGAEEALHIGLVGQVTAMEELEIRGREVAAQIAEGGPLAIALCKRSLRASLYRTLDDELEAEASAQATNYATLDFSEGVKAAREKRVPQFTGQ